ncbi:MYG1 family protein [Patescibacteria group bacterium]|nr:MYG1 family protein [Patescibacteria group bacterium]MCL5091827.1 MYG1 family protein [Patescibacteria group bacterium]
MKTIVTHLYPDADAVTAAWLVKRYLPGWKNAEVVTVPAGETLDQQPVDSQTDVIHVDTGLGRFDHHQTAAFTCATKLVFQHLEQNSLVKNDGPALERLVNFINAVDNFQDVNFPDPDSDRYDFGFHQLVEGLNYQLPSVAAVTATGFLLLDVTLRALKNKIGAEAAIKSGLVFTSHWGKSLALLTGNSGAIKTALKQGYRLVITKDPKKGSVRIKSYPSLKYALTPIHREIMKADKKGTWFLHVSKNMLLNASAKNPHFIPSPLTLPQLIAIVKKV